MLSLAKFCTKMQLIKFFQAACRQFLSIYCLVTDMDSSKNVCARQGEGARLKEMPQTIQADFYICLWNR